jgi:thiamine pyrophosphokinase
MNHAIIFLAGDYDRHQIPFYRRLCRGRITIAADGGHRFFAMAKTQPDLLIGDLDSIGMNASRLPQGLTIIQHPSEKDYTDGELALAYCLDNGARSIDIVDPAQGQADHFLGNLLMLETAAAHGDRARVRIVNYRHEIRLLTDAGWTVNGQPDDIISVIPLSRRIRLSCTGMAYRAERLLLRRGQTKGLRNCLVNRRARFVVEGKAFVIHNFGATKQAV